MKNYLSVLCLILALNCFSQTNLVNNGSFENYSTCPNAFSQVNYAVGWNKSYIWNSNPGGWHTEYMNSCNGGNWVGVPVNGWGSQSAYNGNGYIAQAPACPSQQANYRENIYTQLASPLQIGATYTISYRISLGDNCRYVANHVCAQIGTDAIFPINNQALCSSGIVSSKTAWTVISTTFVADSNYTYLSIGNFYDDANTTYTLTYSGSSLNNAVYYIDSVQLYMTAPVPTVQSQTACLNGNFSLTDTTSVIGVTWNFGDPGSGPNNISTVLNPTHVFSTSGTFTITATVQFPNFTTSYTQVVSVSSASTNAAFSATNVPCGTPVNFINTSTNYTSCYWDFGDGNFSTQTSPSYTYAGSGSYTVTLVAYGSCGNDTTTQVVTITAPPVDASFTGTATGCTGTLFAFHGIAYGANIYWWDFGDGNNSSVLNPNHAYSSPGSYTVTFIASNFCTSDTVIHTVTVYPSPTVTVTASSDTICTGNTVTLVASGGSGYNWSGGVTATGSSVTDTPSTNTWYIVTTSDSLCTSLPDSVYVVVETCLGISQPDPETALTISPNPARDNLIVACSSAIVEVKVIDLSGRIILRYQEDASANVLSLDLTGVASGEYLVTVQTSESLSTRKLIVQ